MISPEPYRASPEELQAIEEALAEATGEYVLIYGRPRLSGDAVLYETEILRAGHADNQAAIRWAREVVPYERALMHDGRPYLAAPIELRRGRMLVWEIGSEGSQGGMIVG